MRQVKSLLALTLCLFAASLRSQGADPELEALDLKATGNYAESLQKVSQALDRLFAQPAMTPAQQAQAEFLVAMAGNLSSKVPDPQGFARSLQRLRATPVAQKMPVLRGRIDHHLAVQLRLLGRGREAGDTLDALGYVSEFQVIGPLDNERGSGFRRATVLEKAPAVALDLAKQLAGKKRRVGFRAVDVGDVALRTVDLGARMRPNSQALAYLAFSVQSDKARAACLRIASTGSLVVFVNGEEVLRRDCQRRPLGWDQDACSFAIERGANLVVVKACTQAGGFATRMRLTTPEGAPLARDVQISGKAEDVARAGKSKPEPSGLAVAAPRLGGVEWLTRQMRRISEQAAPNGAESRQLGMLAFRLAYLLALRSEDEESNRRDRKWASTAAKLLPDFGAAHYLHAYTLIKRGASVADRDENRRRQAYLDAIRAWPRYAESMRALAEMERSSRENLHKAESWIRKALSINPNYVYAARENLVLLRQRGFRAAEAKSVSDYSTNPKLRDHPDMLTIRVDAAMRTGDLDLAIELQRKLLAIQFDFGPLLRLRRLLAQTGKHQEALELAERTVREFPQIRSSYMALATLHIGRGNRDAAARTWNEWLNICPEDESTWLQLARLAAIDGKTAQQITHLEKALSLNPNLKDQRRHLEYLKAGAKPFYAGFELDAKAALAGDKGADPDAKEKGDSHYYIFRHKLVRAYRDGTTSTYDHFLVRVLNEEGVNLFDTFQADYYSGDQTARILEAKVIRPNGRTERARLGRGVWVDLPVIRPGDCVEVAARVDDRSRSFFGDYFGLAHLFAAYEPVPVRRSRLDLILEPGRKYHFQTVGDVPQPGVEKLADGAEHRRYEMTALNRREVEQRAPSPFESGPLLRVSTYGNWTEFAGWWWNLIRKQTVATPSIQAKVRELTAGADTLEEKVQRIYDFVVTEIRYKAWEFGVHGYKPYSVSAIFERRHGDCKDKAILMNSMLAEIGVKAYPVLIHAEERRQRDDLVLPMVQHFNHCITFIPAQQGLPARFVDGTAQYHPIDTLPTMDRGAGVLTVLAEKGEIMQIPWTRASDNKNEMTYRIRLDAEGNADVELVHRPRLNHAPGVRDRYGNEPGKRRQRLEDSLGSVFGQVEISDMQFSDLKNLRAPVEYTVKFRVKSLAVRDGNQFRIKSAFRPERLARLTAAERRVYDMLLTTPSSRDVTVTYEIPEGFEWTKVPDGVSTKSKVGSFDLSVTKSARTVKVRRFRQLTSQRIGKAEYGVFKELTEAVDRAESRELEFRRIDK